MLQEWLTHLATNHPVLVYAIIIIVSFVEGPILAMLCGLFVKLGSFSFLPLYLALMVGDLIGDVFWYYIGYFVGHPFIRRFGKYFSVTEEGVTKVTAIFHKYHTYILLISKITMGFGFALVTLVTAGIVKIPFKKYIAMNVVGQLVWTGILMAVGYFLGHIYVAVDNVLGKLFIIALFVIAFIGLIGYGKYMRNRMKRSLI